MGDKVYGFCGTNKCKREVVAQSNFIMLLDSVKSVLHPDGKNGFETDMQLPAGWFKENCMIMGVEISFNGTAWKDLTALATETSIYNLNIYTNSNDDGKFDRIKLKVDGISTAYSTNLSVRILVMNTSSVPANKGTITGGGTNPPLGG